MREQKKVTKHMKKKNKKQKRDKEECVKRNVTKKNGSWKQVKKNGSQKRDEEECYTKNVTKKNEPQKIKLHRFLHGYMKISKTQILHQTSV